MTFYRRWGLWAIGCSNLPLVASYRYELFLPKGQTLPLPHRQPDVPRLLRQPPTNYLRGLRLQNLERLDLTALRQMADRFARPKMRRAAEQIITLARVEAEEYEAL